MRVSIPKDNQAEILFSNDHCCCVCHKGSKGGVRIQIHHINEDPSDNRLENLAVLCRDCHDRLKDKLWMGKGFLQGEVKKHKQLWESAVSERRKHFSFPSATVKEKITEVDEKGRVKRRIEREISYKNGLAPQAFGISPPVLLSKEKRDILKEAKQIAMSEPNIEKLLPILSGIKKTTEIRIDDLILLSRICLSIGDSKFHTDDYSMAEIFYREALSYAKRAKESEVVEICLYELGASVGMQGRHREALDCFNEIIKVNKKNAGVWFNKGAALGNLGKHEEALACFDKAMEIKPDDERIWSGKGAALGNLGKYEEALPCFDKAIELKPDDERAWSGKGVALGSLGKYEEALACFDKAMEIKPDDEEAWYNKAVALGKLGKYEEAIACYDKAIELKPDFKEARRARARLSDHER